MATNKGKNPFLYARILGMLYPSTEIDAYDAGYNLGSYSPYKYIENNISAWIEKAITKRCVNIEE